MTIKGDRVDYCKYKITVDDIDGENAYVFDWQIDTGRERLVGLIEVEQAGEAITGLRTETRGGDDQVTGVGGEERAFPIQLPRRSQRLRRRLQNRNCML